MNHNLSFGVLLLKFWLHVIGKIQDGSNADVAVNQYHRYDVRWISMVAKLP